MHMTNKFIKWTSSDDEGEFSHVGLELTSGDTITMMLSDGTELSFPSDDGTVVPAQRPVNFGKVAPSAPRVTVVRAAKAAKPGSKREKALIIVRDLFGKGHGKEMTVQRLIDVLGMSPAGAQTYFYNAKKELAL